MHKLIMTLVILASAIAHGATPKSVTLSMAANTTNALTSVDIGDRYNYDREVDAVKITVSGMTDTNILLVATLGQPFEGVTNTISTQSFSADGTTLTFPRFILSTNHLERFYTDVVSVSCAFVTATNTAVSAALTNASSVSVTIKRK